MEQIDPQVKNLVSAIGRAETGEPSPDAYNKKGASGEFGRYQFMPETYKAYAKKYIGDENAEPNMENQNKIAYAFVKEKKDAGYNPSQIASMWNAGEGRPNAYKEGHSGVNSKGVKYDTPEYALKVSQYYEQSKVQATPQVQPVQQPKKDSLKRASDIVSTVFPGQKVGEAIGTLGGYIASPNKEQYDTSAPNPLQVAGDIAQGALSVAGGLPGGGATSTLGKGLIGSAKGMVSKVSNIGKIGQGMKLGAGLGLTEGIKQGDSGEDVLKKTFQGTLAGGTLASLGIGISKIADYLPQRMLPFKMTPETAQYAATKKLGSPDKMLAASDNELNTLGSKIGSALKSPQYEGMRVTGGDIFPRITSELADANLSPDELVSEITKLAKTKKGLIERLFTPEGLSLEELQRLNSEIGKSTYKSVFDTPETKAGKQIGNVVYHAIGDAIKGIAPETQPLYANMSKEYLLNNTLKKFVNKSGGRTPITLTDLVTFDVAGLPGAVTRKAIANPTVQLKTAGLIKSIGGSKLKDLGRGIKAPFLKGILGSNQK